MATIPGLGTPLIIWVANASDLGHGDFAPLAGEISAVLTSPDTRIIIDSHTPLLSAYQAHLVLVVADSEAQLTHFWEMAHCKDKTIVIHRRGGKRLVDYRGKPVIAFPENKLSFRRMIRLAADILWRDRCRDSDRLAARAWITTCLQLSD